MKQPRCCVKKCPMTAGYYVGGGQYICWLHVFSIPGACDAVKNYPLVALKGTRP